MYFHLCGHTHLSISSVVFYLFFEMVSLTDLRLVDLVNYTDH